MDTVYGETWLITCNYVYTSACVLQRCTCTCSLRSIDANYVLGFSHSCQQCSVPNKCIYVCNSNCYDSAYKIYTGWPPPPSKKNRTAYFPQHVDVITVINVWGNFSWEKWYQGHKCWFSSLFSRAHFVRQCWGQNISLFRRKWMTFRPATVVSSN